jgi:hypothetical protein
MNVDHWDPRLPRALGARENRAFQDAYLLTKNSCLRFPADGVGGADRVRTDDLRLARAALSQLSYSPFELCWPERPALVGLGRLELPTSRLSGVRSNQLSYRPGTGNHADSLETG